MDLTKGGGDWLTTGDYVVSVIGWKNVTANTGSKGYEIRFADGQGKRTKQTYWHTDPEGKPSGALRFLNELAKACGLSEDECKNFEPEMLIGKSVGVKVAPQENDDRYHEVVQTFPASEVEGIRTKDNADGYDKDEGYSSESEIPF